MRIFIKLTFIFIISAFISSCSSDEDKLFRAVKNGDLDQVRSLIQNGVSITITDMNGLTPLDVARLNDQDGIAGYLYERTKDILDKDIEKLLRSEFRNSFRKLKNIEKERIKFYMKYTELNDSLMNSLGADKRVSDDLIYKQGQTFKEHQKLIKKFINAKIDLLEEILKVFIDKNYISSIESKDTRHIVNVNIMHRLSEMN